mmetsp:Transcript_27540/g.77900  ORF Transcript_27540/g.77900 Transcript_27540/m.77900 type:complete len:701 (+) Transcript_27540:1-2103(+)
MPVSPRGIRGFPVHPLRCAGALAFLATVVVAAATVAWIARGPQLRAFMGSSLEVKAQSECEGDGCSCDCSWADTSTCLEDDGDRCFKFCCGSSTKTCEARGGCACDCSWASRATCKKDDDGCCWNCCCGSLQDWSLDAVTPKCPHSPTPEHSLRYVPEHHYDSGSLFCFSLVLPSGYERGLLAMQFRENASIFACDDFAVYSSQVIPIGKGVWTSVVDSDLKCKYGGEFKTALNTDIFIAVWNKVFKDGQFAHHQWSIKVDPDTVFFPWRLRAALEHHPEGSKGVYLNNCKYGLHGPLEVFSRKALLAWRDGKDHCVKHFNEQCKGPCSWGEDMFIDQCLCKVLGVKRDDDFRLLTEDHCDPPQGWKNCERRESASFHPFKKQDEYRECMDNANRQLPPPPTSTTTRTRTTITHTTQTTTTRTTTHTTSTSSTKTDTPTTTTRTTSSTATTTTITTTTLTTATTTTRPTTIIATSTTEMNANESEPTVARTSLAPKTGTPNCDKICEFKGKPRACRVLIQWAADHQFKGKSNACVAAIVMVNLQCPSCWACSLAEANCTTPTYTTTSAAPAKEHAADGFKCDTSRVSSWSAEENMMCCLRKHIGCPTTTSTTPLFVRALAETTTLHPATFNCEVLYVEQVATWSPEKRAWCCVHAERGCEEFDCSLNLPDGERSWSDDKKTWCCKHDGRGCAKEFVIPLS